MRSVDKVRSELNIASRELLERRDALESLEASGFDVSVYPDDYHKWERARASYVAQIESVTRLESELYQCGNR